MTWRTDKDNLNNNNNNRGFARRYTNKCQLLMTTMTWRTDWVEIDPEGEPGDHDNHAARNVDADDVKGELPEIYNFGDYCDNLLM